jgi:hypothetical protein
VFTRDIKCSLFWAKNPSSSEPCITFPNMPALTMTKCWPPSPRNLICRESSLKWELVHQRYLLQFSVGILTILSESSWWFCHSLGKCQNKSWNCPFPIKLVTPHSFKTTAYSHPNLIASTVDKLTGWQLWTAQERHSYSKLVDTTSLNKPKQIHVLWFKPRSSVSYYWFSSGSAK